MYQQEGLITEEGFVGMAKALYRFSVNLKLESSKEDYVRQLYTKISAGKKKMNYVQLW